MRVHSQSATLDAPFTINPQPRGLMPVVMLMYKPGRVPWDQLAELADALPRIVSDALDVPDDPGKRLTEKNIQVKGILPDPFDRNLHELQLTIPIHAYPERIANLEERKDRIVAAIREIVGTYDPHIGWVWVQPVSDTAFGRI